MKSLFPFLSILLPFLLSAQSPSLFDTHPTPTPFEFLNAGQKAGGQQFWFQDSRGFIWGSSERGRPMRFDGDRIETFENDLEDPIANSTGRMSDVSSRYFEDSEGKLWIVYSRGNYVDCFDPETGTFLSLDPKLKKAAGTENLAEVRPIYEDHLGRIWLGSGKRVFRYDKDRDSLLVFSFSQRVTLLFEDTEQQMWGHLIYGDLVRFNAESGAIEERINYPESLKPNRDKDWADAYNDHHLKLKNSDIHLLIVRGLLYEFDATSKTITSRHVPPLTERDLICYVWGKEDQVLLTTFSGLLIQYFPDKKILVPSPYFRRKGEDQKQSFLEPIAIFQSRDGIIWMNAIRPDGSIQNLQFFPRKLDMISIPIPAQIRASNQDVGQHDYCVILDGKAWFFTSPWLTPILPDEEYTEKIDLSIPFVTDQDLLTHKFTTDKNGHLWQVATLKQASPVLYIREFDQKGALVKTHVSSSEDAAGDAKGWSNGIVRAIRFDQNGKLWVGMTRGGMFCFDPKDGTFRNFISAFEGELPNVLGLCIDKNNNVWCGGHSGLKKWDQQNEAWTHFSDPALPGGTTIKSILEDASGRIWLGCQNGLVVYDSQQNTFKRFGKSHLFSERTFH